MLVHLIACGVVGYSVAELSEHRPILALGCFVAFIASIAATALEFSSPRPPASSGDEVER